MTRTEIERLAVVESKIDSIEDSVSRIETKLDTAIECKADRSEVAELKEHMAEKASATDFAEMRRLLVGILVSVAGFAVATLIYVVLRANGLLG